MSLADIKARAEKANAEMDRLTAGNPGTNWRWSIPANEDRDSDLILAAPIADNVKMLAALDAVIAACDDNSDIYGKRYIFAGIITDTITEALR